MEWHKKKEKKKRDLEDVFKRSGGELGSKTLVPGTSFLERDIGCGRDYVSASCNLGVKPRTKNCRH